jgi:hypothetical protein
VSGFRMRNQRRPARNGTTKTTEVGQIVEGVDDVARFVAGRRSDGRGQRSQRYCGQESNPVIPAQGASLVQDHVLELTAGPAPGSSAIHCQAFHQRRLRLQRPAHPAQERTMLAPLAIGRILVWGFGLVSFPAL